MKREPRHSRKQDLDRLLSPQLFKAIGDPNRIAILRFLSDRCTPLTVGQIAESLPVDLSVVSRHLAILRDADILICRKQGKEVLYSLNSRNLIATLRAIADAFEACCPDECVMNGEPVGEPERPCPGKGKRRSRQETGPAVNSPNQTAHVAGSSTARPNLNKKGILKK